MGKRSIRAIVIFFLGLIVVVLGFAVLIIQLRAGQLPGVSTFLANNPILSHLAIVPAFKPLNIHHKDTSDGIMLTFSGTITNLLPQKNGIYQIDMDIGNGYPLPMHVVLGMTGGRMLVGHTGENNTITFGPSPSNDVIKTLMKGKPITIYLFSKKSSTSDNDRQYQASQLAGIQKMEAYAQSGKMKDVFFVQADEFVYDP